MVPGGAQVDCVGERVRLDDRGTADPSALGRGDRSGVGGPLDGAGPLHLSKQGQKHDGELAQVTGVGRVDLDGVGEVADPEAAVGEIVGSIWGCRVRCDQPVEVCTKDLVRRDAGGHHGFDLAVEILLRR